MRFIQANLSSLKTDESLRPLLNYVSESADSRNIAMAWWQNFEKKTELVDHTAEMTRVLRELTAAVAQSGNKRVRQ